jgi:hypothetical protein
MQELEQLLINSHYEGCAMLLGELHLTSAHVNKGLRMVTTLVPVGMLVLLCNAQFLTHQSYNT